MPSTQDTRYITGVQESNLQLVGCKSDALMTTPHNSATDQFSFLMSVMCSIDLNLLILVHNVKEVRCVLLQNKLDWCLASLLALPKLLQSTMSEDLQCSNFLHTVQNKTATAQDLDHPLAFVCHWVRRWILQVVKNAIILPTLVTMWHWL